MKKGFLNITSLITKYNIPLCLLGLYALMTYAFGLQNCIVKLLIGYPCPGCGMTRAVLSIIQFDFIAAFNYNPFVFMFPFIVLLVFFKDKGFVKKFINNIWFSIVLLSIVLVVYVLRFILVYPNIPMDYYEHNLLSLIFSFFK